MKSAYPDLNSAFTIECRERMARVTKVVEQSMQPFKPTATCYDQIHQEFDSLCGAARVVNADQLEVVFRTMAVYARFLRNRLAIGVSQAEHEHLRHVAVLIQSSSVLHSSAAIVCPAELIKLCEKVRQMMQHINLPMRWSPPHTETASNAPKWVLKNPFKNRGEDHD